MGVRLTMADGTVSDEFDLVVGCDGLRSAVRQAVTHKAPSPVYSGIRILFAVAPAGTYPKVSERCDACVCLCEPLRDKRGVVRLTDRTALWHGWHLFCAHGHRQTHATLY